jgi:hypothetical protein
MPQHRLTRKLKEWLQRYVPAELLGTLIALIFAWVAYAKTRSYIVATGAGLVGEGIGFYGFIITKELWTNKLHTRGLSLPRRLAAVISRSGTNLLVEFAPAEVLDNFLIRPFALYMAPHYIHPYAVGFVIGKFCADMLFYALAIAGYELKNHWLQN